MYVDLDRSDEIDSSSWSNPSFDTYIPKADYHKSIAFGADKDLSLVGKDVSYLSQDYHDGKVEDLFSNTMWGGETVIAKRSSNTDASAEVGVTLTIGGNEGTKFEFYVSGEVSNDNSKAHVDVTTRDDGTTTIDIGGGTSTNNTDTQNR